MASVWFGYVEKTVRFILFKISSINNSIFQYNYSSSMSYVVFILHLFCVTDVLSVWIGDPRFYVLEQEIKLTLDVLIFQNFLLFELYLFIPFKKLLIIFLHLLLVWFPHFLIWFYISVIKLVSFVFERVQSDDQSSDNQYSWGIKPLLWWRILSFTLILSLLCSLRDAEKVVRHCPTQFYTH